MRFKELRTFTDKISKYSDNLIDTAIVYNSFSDDLKTSIQTQMVKQLQTLMVAGQTLYVYTIAASENSDYLDDHFGNIKAFDNFERVYLDGEKLAFIIDSLAIPLISTKAAKASWGVELKELQLINRALAELINELEQMLDFER